MCRGGTWIFKTKIHVCHHGPAFFSLIFSWWLHFGSPSVFATQPFLIYFNSFFMSFILLAFLLCCFRFHILHQNRFVSFVSGCWFNLVYAPPASYIIIISLSLNLIFCIFIFQLCGTISYAFLKSSQANARFLRLVLLSLVIYIYLVLYCLPSCILQIYLLNERWSHSWLQFSNLMVQRISFWLEELLRSGKISLALKPWIPT